MHFLKYHTHCLALMDALGIDLVCSCSIISLFISPFFLVCVCGGGGGQGRQEVRLYLSVILLK